MNSPIPFINLLVIRSPDIHRAKSFYTMLGLSFELHSHGKGPEHYTSVANGVVFEIYPLTTGHLPTTSTRLGFHVSNVDDLLPALTQIGGTLVSPPPTLPGAVVLSSATSMVTPSNSLRQSTDRTLDPYRNKSLRVKKLTRSDRGSLLPSRVHYRVASAVADEGRTPAATHVGATRSGACELEPPEIKVEST
jgi:hypothetical protein